MDQYQAAMVRSARNGGVVCVQGEALLLDGQDPTCIVVESALNIAVVRGHKEIVGVQFDTARSATCGLAPRCDSLQHSDLPTVTASKG